MKLSILGSGRVAYSVARQAIAAGHEIVIGTRDPSKIDRKKWVELPSVKFTSISEAGLGDVVLLAVPWEHVDHVLEQIPTWSILADYSYLVECNKMMVYFAADTTSSFIQFSGLGSATLSDIR